MTNDLNLICDRIDALFVRAPRVRYWLLIVDDSYDQTYNFFFESRQQAHRTRSTPLHTIERHDLGYLETIINGIQQHTQLTQHFKGFTGQRWPRSQRIIQRKKDVDEERTL